jgi:hypothetical protein
MSFGDDARDAPPDPLADWPAFAGAVRARLEQGRAVYGDQSFARAPGELLGEIRAELMDVCAWSFILAKRLEAHGPASAPSAPSGRTQDEATPARSVHLAGFTPQTLALLAEIAERLRRPPGEVVDMALRVLVAEARAQCPGTRDDRAPCRRGARAAHGER